MSSKMNKKHLLGKSLTRFNVIYEDHYKIFLNYLKGELNMHDIDQKYKNCQI